MKGINQPAHLLQVQYKDATNLHARIALHARFSSNPEPWWAWVWRMMALPDRARMLEVGTGPADLWRANLDNLPAGWDIILSDFSPGMIAQARENLGARAQRFAFARIDVMDIPFPDETFDAAVANFMLYHAPDPQRAIAELHRVLKPGGRLYAATNGFRHMKQLWDMVRSLNPDARISTGRDFFRLDDGADLLHRYFPTVNRYLYDDALQVTEAEPLAAYWASMYPDENIQEKLQRFRQAVQEVIDQKEAFFIEKHSGLFEAIKGHDSV